MLSNTTTILLPTPIQVQLPPVIAEGENMGKTQQKTSLIVGLVGGQNGWGFGLGGTKLSLQQVLLVQSKLGQLLLGGAASAPLHGS